MSVKGQIKEAAGFVKEEAYEHGKDPESKKKAQEGRDLRNEGRIEDGKEPKTTKPGHRPVAFERASGALTVRRFFLLGWSQVNAKCIWMQ